MGGYLDQDQQEKTQIIKEMGSQDNVTALRAVEKLRERGWLTDGTLKGVSLAGANLEGANLDAQDQDVDDERHLEAVDLTGVNLRDANLSKAVLRGAFLRDADLAGADMRGADLQRADLRQADLRGAILNEADLQMASLAAAFMEGAFLERAFLTGANLRRAIMRNAHLTGAILPDGNLWSPAVDLMRYTHPTLQASRKRARIADMAKLKKTAMMAPPPSDDIIAHLDRLADEAREKISTAETTELKAYWRGVTFGLEQAASELRSGKR